MKYSELVKYWMENKDQGDIPGFNPIVKDQNIPTSSLKPEDMMALSKASSPYDLYQKPDSTPWGDSNYLTSSFQLNPRGGGIPRVIAMASQEPKSELLKARIESMSSSADRNYTEKERPYALQGTYEHEKGHAYDPRLNSMANNYGYLVRDALQGNVASREAPAMDAERRYFGKLWEQGKI